MKIIISILIVLGLSQKPEIKPIEDEISPGAIEFLKEHDAYDDVIDAFYSDSLNLIN